MKCRYPFTSGLSGVWPFGLWLFRCMAVSVVVCVCVTVCSSSEKNTRRVVIIFDYIPGDMKTLSLTAKKNYATNM